MAKDSSLGRSPLPARLVLGAGLLLLVAAAYYFIFHADLDRSLEAAARRERDLREELGKTKKAVFAYHQDLREYEQREQRRAEIEKILPSEAQYPALLSSLQAVANLTSVSLSAWAPQPERAEEFYVRVPMKLELVGRYHQVARFFYLVSQLDRVVNMENISITEPKIEGDEVLVKVGVLATAFRSLGEGQPASDKTRARDSKSSVASEPSHGGMQ